LQRERALPLQMRQMSFRTAMVAACCASGLITAACAVSAPGPELNADLSGTRWVASSIDGAPVAERAPQLTFGAEDRLSGTSGCNSVVAVYEAKNGHIDVRALGHTERACEAPLMRQEQAFLSILDGAARYERAGNQLVIIGEDGARLSLEMLG
jgi:heat shock protein HslJ